MREKDGMSDSVGSDCMCKKSADMSNFQSDMKCANQFDLNRLRHGGGGGDDCKRQRWRVRAIHLLFSIEGKKLERSSFHVQLSRLLARSLGEPSKAVTGDEVNTLFPGFWHKNEMLREESSGNLRIGLIDAILNDPFDRNENICRVNVASSINSDRLTIERVNHM